MILCSFQWRHVGYYTPCTYIISAYAYRMVHTHTHTHTHTYITSHRRNKARWWQQDSVWHNRVVVGYMSIKSRTDSFAAQDSIALPAAFVASCRRRWKANPCNAVCRAHPITDTATDNLVDARPHTTILSQCSAYDEYFCRIGATVVSLCDRFPVLFLPSSLSSNLSTSWGIPQGGPQKVSYYFYRI